MEVERLVVISCLDFALLAIFSARVRLIDEEYVRTSNLRRYTPLFLIEGSILTVVFASATTTVLVSARALTLSTVLALSMALALSVELALVVV